MTWEEVKQGGSKHYKRGAVEPIDLYQSMSPMALHHWAILEIVAHALRNISPSDTLFKDMEKIEHYSKMIRANIEKVAKNEPA